MIGFGLNLLRKKSIPLLPRAHSRNPPPILPPLCPISSRSGSKTTATSATMAEETPDYKTWDHDRLIARVMELESRLKEQQHTGLRGPRQLSQKGNRPVASTCPQKTQKSFDPSKYSTRHIALKFAYLGQRYNGYEHHNGNATPLPTIEGTLWKALRRSFLINPPDVDGLANDEISWEGCQYSKCGRTDRGVSAFGQVIGIRVRSRRPKGQEQPAEQFGDESKPQEGSSISEADIFDDIADEIPYIQVLNNLLPSDIRVLAWCPRPPENFDARFSCKERRYRYFFTQPAFTPTPGPIGFQRVPGSKFREGWLDIDAMKEGAKKLIGLHDFRNFCKVDASKQMSNFMRRIYHADIEVLHPTEGPVGYIAEENFRQFPSDQVNGQHMKESDVMRHERPPSTPLIYSFTIHGSAFLWHQVRCMAAILFLIGQGFESPTLVSELLDVNSNPRKPTYEMAVDAPLVLWDCIFLEEGREGSGTDALDWVYAGDCRGLKSLPGQADGKFGNGGVVEGMWAVWRQRKMDELLSGTLLDLVVGQGNSAVLQNGGLKSPRTVLPVGQKRFEGRDSPRLGGKHIPTMQKPLMETVEMQNAKWMARKGRSEDPSESANGEESQGFVS